MSRAADARAPTGSGRGRDARGAWASPGKEKWAELEGI
jgi:hypothetical protein